MMGSSAILGGSIALALGAAFAFQYDKRDLIAVAFLGDAVFEEGIIWECFNVAVLHKLPIFFVCENNRYSTNTHYSRRQPPIPIYQRVGGMGVPSVYVDGNDVVVVAECAGRMIDECRRGGGPQMIEAETYRIREHVGPLFDYKQGIRAKEEVEAWIEKCPVKRLRDHLISCGALSEIELGEMERGVRREIEDALAFAESSAWPDPEGLYDFTY
jgi:pyruvate dehydrogenase E1 component alpha subunit